jgi:hypothetical protein
MKEPFRAGRRSVLPHYVQLMEPQQLCAPVFQLDVHGRVVWMAPALLNGAPHTDEVALAAAFLYSY